MILQLLFLVLTYFISAIPFGLVLGKVFAKKDVREFGSKNIGATNVARVLGKKLGLATLILDGLKGAIMLIIARFAFYGSSHFHLFLVLVAAVAVIAHIYPVYLDFKGGKGVATAVATIFVLDPAVGFLMICFWILSFCLFRISSVASLLSIFSSIILSPAYGAPTSQTIFCVMLFALILYRHKENLLRLITGEEKKL